MARLVDGFLGVSDDHLALRDAVRTLADRHLTSEQVRASFDQSATAPHSSTSADRPGHWTALAEGGFLGLHLPEDVGGSGYGLVETAVVAEELGAHLAPGPFLGTVTVSAALARAGWAAAHATGRQRELLAGLATGQLTAAFVPEGEDLVAEPASDGLVVSGTLTPTPCLAQADLALARVRAGSEQHWVLLQAAELSDLVEVGTLGGLDPTRPLARAEVSAVHVPTERVLGTHAHAPRVLWALLVSAEACGSAAWLTRTAATHAAVREQFDTVIGAFQGVKHRCAAMLARTEQARVVTWDAARALDDLARGEATAEEAALALAVAASIAPQAALDNAKACLDTLGATGYTWEHDCSFHLRRARSTTVLVGGTGRWREIVGQVALRGHRREAGVDLPPEAETVREQIRAELARAAALPAEERAAFLAGAGYTAPHLPTPWGKGADAVTQLVIAEELRATGLTAPNMIIGNWVVPTVVEAGTPEQQERWLPKSLTGEFFWCQLFSEPGAGSDLAALTTRADKVDGGWRVTGTKIWTSAAQYATHGILLARTEPEAAKHAGISYFVLDMSTPGIEIRPIKDLTGSEHFNQVFLDEVFVPDDALVGERGQGWKLARTTLANERVALGTGSLLGSTGESLLAGATALGGLDAGQDVVRTLGRLLADAQSMSLFALRSAIRSVTGAPPGAESSIAKLIGVQHAQEAREIAVEWGGVAGLAGSEAEDQTLWWFLNSRNQSIAGGTLDVQRNIIGERLLGLPRA